MEKMAIRLKGYVFFKLVTIYLRYVIGLAFVFASIGKIQGERFTTLPTTNPVGYFFEAMYLTGAYWNFLGWSQFVAGALLMSQRFSTIGAMVFLPVILNVFMITHSINFGMGTPVITALMLLGTIYLLLWDYQKWAVLFQPDHKIKLDLTHHQEDKFMNDKVWIITALIFISLAIYPWIFPLNNSWVWMLLMLAVGFTSFVVMMVKWRRSHQLASSMAHHSL